MPVIHSKNSIILSFNIAVNLVIPTKILKNRRMHHSYNWENNFVPCTNHGIFNINPGNYENTEKTSETQKCHKWCAIL